jgi:hypothetical protein
MSTTREATEEPDGPVLTAQKALMKAVWNCIVDASSMNVVMSGSEVNAATRALKDAVRGEALAEVEAAVAELHDGTGSIVRESGFPGLPFDPAVVMRNAVHAAIAHLRQGEPT